MEEEIKIETELVSEETVEEELVANDDGDLEEVEVYRSKAGNIVTPPQLRNANQSNERRELCWKYYLETVRDGNPDGKNSALKAGFALNTAINIGNLGWFKKKKDKLRQSKMMTNSERNLARFVNMKITKLKQLEDGSTEEVFDIEKAKLVADISKFILSTIGKDKGYSQKTEVKVTAMPMPILSLDTMEVIPTLDEPNITDKE